MKTFLAALLLGISSGLLHAEISLTEIAALKEYWPSTIRLKQRTEMTVYVSGQPSGLIKAAAGTEVGLIDIQGENVRIGLGLAEAVIPAKQTNLLEVGPKIIEENRRARALIQRQQLITKAHELTTARTPPPAPKIEQKPATAEVKSTTPLVDRILAIPEIAELETLRRDGDQEAVTKLLNFTRSEDIAHRAGATFLLARWLRPGEKRIINYLESTCKESVPAPVQKATLRGIDLAIESGNTVARDFKADMQKKEKYPSTKSN
jgi:hypothetical protein